MRVSSHGPLHTEQSLLYDGRRPGPVAVLIHPAAADTIHDADSCTLPRLQPDRRRALFRACEVPDHA